MQKYNQDLQMSIDDGEVLGEDIIAEEMRGEIIFFLIWTLPVICVLQYMHSKRCDFKISVAVITPKVSQLSHSSASGYK